MPTSTPPTQALTELSRLLDEALDLPEDQRLAWLNGLTEIDESLRRRIRALLTSDESSGYNFPSLPSYLDSELATLDPAGALPGPQEDVTGRVIGVYRLVRELGRGGMGTVWLAEREDGSFKRQVALKLPHSSLPQRQLAERFTRERNILASLEHPHIARLYDAGITPEGRPWLAMEFVVGKSILEHCQEHSPDLIRRLQLFLQVARALQYAHSRLVVHRDLKPNNILVTENGDIRLLDFGIAKLLHESDATGSALTEFDSRALTPQYAAPEQILGNPVDTAADLYTLGLILYELLTGILPYRIKRDTRGALEEAILEAAIPPASTSAAGRYPWAKALRGDLDTILSKALKKSPAERYATAAAFAEDIERHLAGQPVLAQPDSLAYRSGKFLRRHRWGLAATALIVISLVGGLGAALWQARVAEEHAELARKEAKTAKAVKDFLQGTFLANSAQQADPLKARQTTARELLDIGAERLEEALADSPEALGEMLWTFSELYSQLLLPDRARAFAERRLQLVRQTHGPNSLELGEAMFMVAVTSRSVWMDDPTVPQLLDQAMEIFSRLPEHAHRYRVALGQSAENRSDYDFPQALRDIRIALNMDVNDPEDASVPPKQAAAIELLAGEPQRARDAALLGLTSEAAYEAARAAGTSKAGDGGMLQRPSLLGLLASAYWDLEQYEEAIVQDRKALAAAHQVFGENDPDTARLQAQLSTHLRARGQTTEADTLLAAAQTTLAGGRSDDRTRLRFFALAALGQAERDAGQYGRASNSISQALSMRNPSIVASPMIARLLRIQAGALIGLGQPTEATHVLERAVAMREKSGIAPPAVLREEMEIKSRLAHR